MGTNLTRCNAFFVQNDYVNLINIKLPNQNDLFNHTNSNIRESRDKDGNLNYLSGSERIKNIFECEVFDLNENKIVKIQNLFKGN